jgi:hypothetical protein
MIPRVTDHIRLRNTLLFFRPELGKLKTGCASAIKTRRTGGLEVGVPVPYRARCRRRSAIGPAEECVLRDGLGYKRRRGGCGENEVSTIGLRRVRLRPIVRFASSSISWLACLPARFQKFFCLPIMLARSLRLAHYSLPRTAAHTRTMANAAVRDFVRRPVLDAAERTLTTFPRVAEQSALRTARRGRPRRPEHY